MEPEKEDKWKIDLDTILVEEIGQFGKFQLKTCIFVAIIGICAAISINGYVSTTGRINTRCVIPECEGVDPEWAPDWISDAIPSNGPNTFDHCHRYGNTTYPLHLANDTCSITYFDKDIVQTCEKFVYENNYTIVYEFDLGCNEWARTLIGTIRTAGMIIALPMTGYISDRWGRRTALCITSFNTACFGIIRYWTNTYIAFVISEFLEAVFGSGCYTSAYILMLELLGPKYRMCAGAALNTFFSFGVIIMGLTSWALRYWRHILLAVYIPQLLTLSYYFLIPESARWYMSKGRFAESEALLNKVATVNGTYLSEKSLKMLRRNAEEEVRKKEVEIGDNVEQEWLVVTLFKHKRMLFRCAIAPIWWITGTFIYYGLSINAVNLSGNRYLNYIAVAAIEIPGHWVSVLLLYKIGRKPVLILAFWCCAACQIAYIFMPEGSKRLSLVVYMIAQFCIAIVMVALYTYTAELYPTVKRQILLSCTSMIGRIGSMIAPLTPAFGAQWFPELPFVLFAGLALLSGALVFLMPETRGTKLPDTFEQAEAIGQKDIKTDK